MPKKTLKTENQAFATVPQLNLFTKEDLQVSIEILPTGTWDSANEVTFNVHRDPESFIDPSSLRIVVETKIVLENGGEINPSAARVYAPIANFGCSLFEKVAVRLGNSTQISGLDSLYPYLTYLENVFKTPRNQKKQLNFPYVLYPDESEFFDRLDAENNDGYQSRQTGCNGSKEMYISVPIFLPITSQEKLLIPGVDMHVRMVRSSPNFALMSTLTRKVTVKKKKTIPAVGNEPAKEVFEDVEEQVPVSPKIQIFGIKLLVRKYRLSPLFHMDIANELKLGQAVYPCKYQQLLEFSRVPGTSVIRETLFTDRILPKTVYLFVLSTQRRLGDYKLNPWLLEWSDLSELKLISGGESYPPIPYKPHHLHKKVNDAYMTMLRLTGSLEPGHSNGINMGDYLTSTNVMPAPIKLQNFCPQNINTCYANAVVQALLGLDGFRESVSERLLCLQYIMYIPQGNGYYYILLSIRLRLNFLGGINAVQWCLYVLFGGLFIIKVRCVTKFFWQYIAFRQSYKEFIFFN